MGKAKDEPPGTVYFDTTLDDRAKAARATFYATNLGNQVEPWADIGEARRERWRWIVLAADRGRVPNEQTCAEIRKSLIRGR